MSVLYLVLCLTPLTFDSCKILVLSLRNCNMLGMRVYHQVLFLNFELTGMSKGQKLKMRSILLRLYFINLIPSARTISPLLFVS